MRAIITLAGKYGRYGYSRITVLLWEAGWQVGKDRVERIWRRERLKVPQKQRPLLEAVQIGPESFYLIRGKHEAWHPAGVHLGQGVGEEILELFV